MSKKDVMEKLKNPLTPRAFIIGLIIAVVATFISEFGMGLAPFVLVADTFADRAIFTIIVLVILSIVINPMLTARGFSSGELVVIYVMSGISVITSDSAGPIMYNFIAYKSNWSAEVLQWTPEIWCPKDPNILQSMITGGAISWAQWAPTVAYWILFDLAFLGIGMPFGFILRHSIIEVERLPFPSTQYIAPLTSEVKKPVRERINVPLLLVGFVIGFIIQGTYGFFQRVIPGFPDFWLKGVLGYQEFDLGPLVGLNISRNQHLVIFTENLPSLFAFFFLMPTKILGSALLVHFLLGNVLAYVEVSLGMVTNVAIYGLYDIYGWLVHMYGTFFEPTGIQWFAMAFTGFPIGFIIAYIFFVRREIAASLKEAIRGSRSESILWIAFVGSIILFTALSSGVGVPLAASLFIVFYTFVHQTIALRMRGESMLDVPVMMEDYVDSSFLASGGVKATQGAYMGAMYGDIVSSISYNWSAVTMPLEGIRLLELSGEKWRWSGVMISAVIVTVLSAVLNFTLFLWGTYNYGLQRWYLPKWQLGNNIRTSINTAIVPSSYEYGTVPIRFWPEVTIGVIVAMAVTALNSIFIWWPIHPLGLILGPVLGLGFWTQALLAFIARVLVLKIGGGKLYSKVIQVCLGLILGYAVIQLSDAIAYMAGVV